MDRERFPDMPFPINGVDTSPSYDEQKPNTTIEGVNVRTFEAGTQRGRGGSRGGLIRYLDDRVGGLDEPIQHLNFIVDPSSDFLLLAEEIVGVEYMVDYSTNNFRLRVPTGRTVRMGGSGETQDRFKLKKKKPYIVWPRPADIQVGTPLGDTQLNAVVKDPDSDFTITGGEKTYTPPAGTILKKGRNRRLNVVWKPEGEPAYTSARGKTYINVVETGDLTLEQGRALGVVAGGFPLELDFTDDVKANSLLLLFIATGGTPDPIDVTDSQGNTYTLVQSTIADPMALYIYRAKAASAGPCSIFVDTDIHSLNAFTLEISGCPAANPITGIFTSSGTSPAGGTASSGNIPVTTPDSFVYAIFAHLSANDMFFSSYPTGIPPWTWQMRTLNLTKPGDPVGVLSASALGFSGTNTKYSVATPVIANVNGSGSINWRSIGISVRP